MDPARSTSCADNSPTTAPQAATSSQMAPTTDSAAAPSRPATVQYVSAGVQTSPLRKVADFVKYYGRKPKDWERAPARFEPPSDEVPFESSVSHEKVGMTDAFFQSLDGPMVKMGILKAKIKAKMTAKKHAKAAKEGGVEIWAEEREEKILHSEQVPTSIKLDGEGNLVDGNIDTTDLFLPNIWAKDLPAAPWQPPPTAYQPPRSIEVFVSKTVEAEPVDFKEFPSIVADGDEFANEFIVHDPTTERRKKNGNKRKRGEDGIAAADKTKKPRQDVGPVKQTTEPMKESMTQTEVVPKADAEMAGKPDTKASHGTEAPPTKAIAVPNKVVSGKLDARGQTTPAATVLQDTTNKKRGRDEDTNLHTSKKLRGNDRQPLWKSVSHPNDELYHKKTPAQEPVPEKVSAAPAQKKSPTVSHPNDELYLKKTSAPEPVPAEKFSGASTQKKLPAVSHPNDELYLKEAPAPEPVSGEKISASRVQKTSHTVSHPNDELYLKKTPAPEPAHAEKISAPLVQKKSSAVSHPNDELYLKKASAPGPVIAEKVAAVITQKKAPAFSHPNDELYLKKEPTLQPVPAKQTSTSSVQKDSNEDRKEFKIKNAAVTTAKLERNQQAPATSIQKEGNSDRYDVKITKDAVTDAQIKGIEQATAIPEQSSSKGHQKDTKSTSVPTNATEREGNHQAPAIHEQIVSKDARKDTSNTSTATTANQQNGESYALAASEQSASNDDSKSQQEPKTARASRGRTEIQRYNPRERREAKNAAAAASCNTPKGNGKRRFEDDQDDAAPAPTHGTRAQKRPRFRR
ncbi:hypothetical protein IQ07DRAFT_642131 [Pyrenochaeta sp. DS3sAY3a]|nr:hypothetical protein IQ07DRAFT_642131 [Pyrenochaeta sp. DS3sAY3a]